MKHVIAFAIKFVVSLVLLYLILGGIRDITFGDVFLITAVLGVLAYVIGDLFILPRTNNTIATIADFGLALVVIWFMVNMMTYADTGFFGRSLMAAIGVAIFEMFFHRYLSKNIIQENDSNGRKRHGNLEYQTEYAEEIHPDSIEKREE
jgi:hypothetical protein